LRALQSRPDMTAATIMPGPPRMDAEDAERGEQNHQIVEQVIVRAQPYRALDAETEAEITAEAPEMIPVCVYAIRDFWRERMSQSSPIRNPSKVGRNEPCPCGSGRKYKRCCGAN
jgi:hypothetical protein